MIKRRPYIQFWDIANILYHRNYNNDVSLLPEQGAVSYAGYSRFGLLNILRLLGLGRGDKVLLPAYNCNVTLLPMELLGITPVYYGITDDFQIDFSTIELSTDIKAIITVNYFGFSPDIIAIGKFAQDNNLIWINDNAHGYASSHGENSLLSFGDFSITSLWKIIPALNGSLVSINSSVYSGLADKLNIMNLQADSEPAARYLLTSLLKNIGFNGKPIQDYSDIYGFVECDLKPCRIHDYSLRLMRICNTDQVRSRRRKLYETIENMLLENQYGFVRPVKGIMKEGNSPMVFPVITAAHEQRQVLMSAARKEGIDIHTWPSMPESVIQNNLFGAVDTWRRMLYLPIHQDIEPSVYLAVLRRVLEQVHLRGK